MTCLKYYPLCLLTKTVFCLHFIIHDTTAKKKSLVIFFFSAILRIQLLQFMRYAMKALRCNGFVAGPNSAILAYPWTVNKILNCRAAERKDDTVENEQMLEQKKLDEFLQVINENLKELREKKKEVDQENKELYDAYMEGDVELYSSLMVSSTMQ